MKALAVFSVLAVLAANVSALTVNTPSSIVQCEPVQFTWTDGTAPYYLSLLPGGDVSGSALKSFGATSDTSYTWTADIDSGTSITVALRDSTGTQVYSDAVTIQSSSDSSCLSSTVDESSSTASGSGTTAASGSTTASTTSSSGSTSASGSKTSSGSTTHSSTSGSASSGATTKTTASTSSTASSSSTATNAAVRGSSMGAIGLAGLMGVVGAALF